MLVHARPDDRARRGELVRATVCGQCRRRTDLSGSRRPGPHADLGALALDDSTRYLTRLLMPWLMTPTHRSYAVATSSLRAPMLDCMLSWLVTFATIFTGPLFLSFDCVDVPHIHSIC